MATPDDDSITAASFFWKAGSDVFAATCGSGKEFVLWRWDDDEDRADGEWTSSNPVPRPEFQRWNSLMIDMFCAEDANSMQLSLMPNGKPPRPDRFFHVLESPKVESLSEIRALLAKWMPEYLEGALLWCDHIRPAAPPNARGHSSYPTNGQTYWGSPLQKQGCSVVSRPEFGIVLQRIPVCDR